MILLRRNVHNRCEAKSGKMGAQARMCFEGVINVFSNQFGKRDVAILLIF